jgi:hypothetical protein
MQRCGRAGESHSIAQHSRAGRQMVRFVLLAHQAVWL